MARTGYLSLRLSQQERARYQQLADEQGVTLAEWCRYALRTTADKKEEARPQGTRTARMGSG